MPMQKLETLTLISQQGTSGSMRTSAAVAGPSRRAPGLRRSWPTSASPQRERHRRAHLLQGLNMADCPVHITSLEM